MRALSGRALLDSPALRPVLLLVALLVLWQAAVSLFAIPKWLIPAPLEVITEIGKEWPRLWREGLVTGYASLLGFLISVAIGIPLAMAIAVVMTERPGTIAAIYPVPLRRPRRLDDMGAPGFVDLVQTVRRHFHAEATVDL